MIRPLAMLFGVLDVIGSVEAHRSNTLHSPEEVQRAIVEQASLYHCYPAISQQLIERKSRYRPSGAIHPLFVDQQQSEGEPSIASSEGDPEVDRSSKIETLSFGNPVDRQNQSDRWLSSDDQISLECQKSPTPNEDDDHHRLKSRPHYSLIKQHSGVFAPIVTSGPYYHLSGHPIRQNIAEWQDGVPFLMDIGVINVETCQPVQGALVDIWHANATGHYAGHPVPASGLENEEPAKTGKRAGLLTAYPRTNFHEQFLRGAWPTDSKGVSHFTSIFPGYYTGRATHVHAKVHMNWEMNPNGTFHSSNVQHIGQFFFDDEINQSIDKMSPYTHNPVKERTRNWRDSLEIFPDSKVGKDKDGNIILLDPLFEIEKLGGVINQGLIGYITIGINITQSLPH